MTVATNDVYMKEYDGNNFEYDVVASDIIYDKTVCGNSSGNARPLVAGDIFIGINVSGKVDNSSGAAGDKKIRLARVAFGKVAITGVTSAADTGKKVYASDDNTYTLTATSNTCVGRLVKHISSTTAIVRFDVADQV